jgi:hypothetical protein
VLVVNLVIVLYMLYLRLDALGKRRAQLVKRQTETG